MIFYKKIKINNKIKEMNKIKEYPEHRINLSDSIEYHHLNEIIFFFRKFNLRIPMHLRFLVE